jgi:lysophospholipase L1-like esterase
MVAMLVRDIPAAVITLKVGINIYGAGSYGPRTFCQAAIGFVRIIREKQPEVPIGLISPIVSPEREDTPGPCNMTLMQMRQQLAEAAERLSDFGDSNIHYFDGLALLDRSQSRQYLPDGLHPNADGYELLGRNVAEQILAILGF